MFSHKNVPDAGRQRSNASDKHQCPYHPHIKKNAKFSFTGKIILNMLTEHESG